MGVMGMFARQKPSVRFAAGRVGYAVGDIHGRADLLTKMLGVLAERTAEDVSAGRQPIIVFLGDYVDRGPDSIGVVARLCALNMEGVELRYLRGNHEQLMMAFIEAPMANRAWILQGGAETVRSYGVQPPAPVGAKEEDWIAVAKALGEKLPAEHRAFLEGLERYIPLGDYAFVHAGVDFDMPLEKQTDDDLYWARDRFLASKRAFSHCVVHGHTPVDKPYADQRRVAIDTGAYASGVLTAARFEGDDVTFLQVSAR
jgi:serine/threonine protein phosphatase 1